MITLTAKIDLITGQNQGLRVEPITLSRNNISSEIGAVLGVKQQTSNPFIFGVNKFGDETYLSSGVDYFIGSEFSDNKGVFNQPYEFVVYGEEKLDTLTIAFDPKANSYPKNIEIVNSIIDDSPSKQVEDYYYLYSNAFDMEEPEYYEIVGVYASGRKLQANEYEIAGIEYSYGAIRYGIRLGKYQYFDYGISVVLLIVPKNAQSIFYNDDPYFTFTVSDVNACFVRILDWNTTNSPLVISGIYADITIDIDYKNLISINGSIFERGETKLPSYGIISNNGELEFNDIDGEIKDYADLLLVNSDLKVVVTLKNTLSKKEEQVGVFQTESWNYDNDNRSVSVSLKDDLEEWQDIQVKGFSYDPREPFKVIEYGKMSNVYRWLQQQDENGNDRTPQKYDMLSFDELDIETKTILENTTIDYPLLEDGTLWEQWTKLCEVCGLYIYKRKDGKTVCSYTYGS